MRLLLVSPFAPRLDAEHGGGRAIAQLVRALAPGRPTALLYCRADDEPPLDPALTALLDAAVEIRRPLPGTAAGRLSRRLRLLAGAAAGRPMWVSRWALPRVASALGRLARDWQPDIVQFEYHVMAQHRHAVSPRVPTVLVEYEPGVTAAEAAAAGAAGLRRAAAELDRRAWHRFEPAVLASVDLTVAFTERDAAVLRRIAPGARVRVIPLGIEVDGGSAAPPLGGSASRVLFVGNCMHPPNRDAARRLADRIMPEVRRRHPAAVLDLVGPETPPELGGAGVVVHGRVPSVEPFLAGAAVVAAPIHEGGGMRLKVLEAMAAGKAIVATPLATEGLAVTDGDQLRLADSDAEAAAAIAALLDDPSGRERLGARARAWVREHHGWSRIRTEYDTLYAELGGSAA